MHLAQQAHVSIAFGQLQHSHPTYSVAAIKPTVMDTARVALTADVSNPRADMHADSHTSNISICRMARTRAQLLEQSMLLHACRLGLLQQLMTQMLAHLRSDHARSQCRSTPSTACQ